MSLTWPKRSFNKSKRYLILIHRWVSLTFGIFFVLYCTAGAILVYQPEMTRLLKPSLYTVSKGEPISFTAALDEVHKINPGFTPTREFLSRGLYQITNGHDIYYLNAATGKVNGDSGQIKAISLIQNFHVCLMDCSDYAGYIPWLDKPSFLANTSFFSGLPRGEFIIDVIGIIAIIIIISGFFIWLPKRKRWKQGFTIDWKKGRYKRDYDLHKVIGIISVIPLIILTLTGMWTVTKGLQKLWFTVTDSPATVPQHLTLTKIDANTKPITFQQAINAAESKFPDAKVSTVYFPLNNKAPYRIFLTQGFNTWGYYTDGFTGNREVDVDQYDAKNTAIIAGKPKGWADAASASWFKPVIHYGVTFNPWIRIIWFIFGMTPLILMITGISTWLVKRSVKKKRENHMMKIDTES